MKLIHYYHVFVDPFGNWRQIVAEHCLALQASGLLAAIDEIRLGIVGNDVGRKRVQEYFFQRDIPIDIIASADDGWEQETIDFLWERAKYEDGYIFYAHTKGASSPTDLNIVWRQSMTLATVCGWQRCVRELAWGATAVGCHWITMDMWPVLTTPQPFAGVDGDQACAALLERETGWQPPAAHRPNPGPCGGWSEHFAGNFWWADPRWIRTLSRPFRTSRYDAEVWIGGGLEADHSKFVNLVPGLPSFNNFIREVPSWAINPAI